MAKTLAEMMAENDAQAKRISELEAQLSSGASKITVKMSEFGSGTISAYGLNGGRPVSLYLNQWEMMPAIAKLAMEYGAKHADQLRCAAYASEACKIAKVEWNKKETGADGNATYKVEYAKFYAQAMKDPTLVSSKAVKTRNTNRTITMG